MKKKYAICGVSKRMMGHFIKPMLSTFNSQSEIVGLLDNDPARFELFHQTYPDQEIAAFKPEEFDKMVLEKKPDVVIVASRDDTHAEYIVKALEHDLDVITEKPMAITGSQCRSILDAEAASKGQVTVAFNYRYAPIHTRIKELILEGKLGHITSVDLNWYIDTYHGSSYFKRWNRMRDFSGGLSIHKSSHHFDLVHWWLDQDPVEAFAYGKLNYFGADSEFNPRKVDGRYCATCEDNQDCDYYTRWNTRSQDMKVKDDHIESDGSTKGSLYTDYRQDQCIFDSEIEIEDTYAAVVKYDKGALLSYSVNFSLPYEGYRLAINGTKGRLETQAYHAAPRIPFPTTKQTIDYFPLFGSKETINVVWREGGHGGGDPVLREDLFLGENSKRSYPILSGAMDGALSVATGEAVWRSAHENRPIKIKDVLR